MFRGLCKKIEEVKQILFRHRNDLLNIKIKMKILGLQPVTKFIWRDKCSPTKLLQPSAVEM